MHTLPGLASGRVESRLELLLQGNSPKCPRGIFSFGEKSSCSILWLPLYKEGPDVSHSPPLQLGRGLSPSGSHTAQLSTLFGQLPVVSLGFPLRPYSPPCDFRQVGLSPCCSGLVWQWRGLLTRLSPRSPAAGPARGKPGAVAALVPGLVPGTFLSWSNTLTFCFLSVFCTFWSPVFLNSGLLLAICLFLSRVGRCFTQVQGEVNSAPTYLASIFSPNLVCFI